MLTGFRFESETEICRMKFETETTSIKNILSYLVKYFNSMPEDDWVGYLHHGGLQVQGHH